MGTIAPTSSKREQRAKHPVILAFECLHMYVWGEGGTKAKIISEDHIRAGVENKKAAS